MTTQITTATLSPEGDVQVYLVIIGKWRSFQHPVFACMTVFDWDRARKVLCRVLSYWGSRHVMLAFLERSDTLMTANVLTP